MVNKNASSFAISWSLSELYFLETTTCFTCNLLLQVTVLNVHET